MSWATAAAVICAGLAGALVPRRRQLLARRLGSTAADPGRATARLVGLAAQRLRSRGDRRRQDAHREAEVAAACVALSAELRTGVPTNRALSAVAGDWPDLLSPAAARAAVGGDVAGALRDTANRAGAGALAAIAASWDVSERTGAPLARVLMAVADSLRTAAAVRREAQSQLASARTTARLMAILPFGTLLLLSGDGAALGFLFATSYGLVCLVTGAGFVVAGLWWVRLVTRSAMRSVWEP